MRVLTADAARTPGAAIASTRHLAASARWSLGRCGDWPGATSTSGADPTQAAKHASRTSKPREARTRP